MDTVRGSVYAFRMAKKAISVDLEAHERLRRARLHPNEPFSRVIKRAVLAARRSTAAGLLERLESAPPVDASVIRRLEAAQKADPVSRSAWTRARPTRRS